MHCILGYAIVWIERSTLYSMYAMFRSPHSLNALITTVKHTRSYGQKIYAGLLIQYKSRSQPESIDYKLFYHTNPVHRITNTVNYN